MPILQEIRRRLKLLTVPLFWLVLTVYCGYHAVNGERGLRRLIELRQEIQIASQVAEEVALRRAEMERQIRQLSSQNIDPDTLEESARTLLNMSKDGDYIILDTTE